MTRKLHLFVLLVALPSALWCQSYLKPDFEQLSVKCEKFEPEELGFAKGQLPSKVSLVEYCPPVIAQEGSSCTGFATCYGAMSIMSNVVDDRTEFAEKMVTCFDPYMLYAGIKDKADLDCFACECGAYLTDGLDFLKAFGGKRYWVSPDVSCESRIYSEDMSRFKSRISNYKIDEYYSLVDYTETASGWIADPDIEMIKEMLAGNYPIIGGMAVDRGFNEVTSSGIYSPGLYAGEGYGGHAVTIVGYDDFKAGGSFLILNSYGSDWGMDGYFWLKYSDAEKYLDEAYFMYREDLFEGWREDIDASNYTRFTSDGVHYEGGCNAQGYVHGACYEISEGNWGATGVYKNGYRDGAWMLCDFSNIKDPFFGYIYFEDGDVVDAEAFGFAGTEQQANPEAVQLFEMLQLEVEDGEVRDEEALIQQKPLLSPRSQKK